MSPNPRSSPISPGYDCFCRAGCPLHGVEHRRARGTELARRRLLSRMFREETERGMIELEAIQREFSSRSLSAFKTDLIDMLSERDYSLNDYGIDNVLLHIAIAVDRVSKNQPVAEPEDPAAVPAGGIHSALSLHRHPFRQSARRRRHRLPGVPDHHPGGDPGGGHRRFRLPQHRRPRRRAEHRAERREEYLVDLSDEDFITRLTLHVQNLLRRAHEHSYSRNPLARSIKTSYPISTSWPCTSRARLQTPRSRRDQRRRDRVHRDARRRPPCSAVPLGRSRLTLRPSSAPTTTTCTCCCVTEVDADAR